MNCWQLVSCSGDVSNTLQEVTVPIISNKECRMTGYSKNRITDNMLCAGFKEGEKDRQVNDYNDQQQFN